MHATPSMLMSARRGLLVTHALCQGHSVELEWNHWPLAIGLPLREPCSEEMEIDSVKTLIFFLYNIATAYSSALPLS